MGRVALHGSQQDSPTKRVGCGKYKGKYREGVPPAPTSVTFDFSPNTLCVFGTGWSSDIAVSMTKENTTFVVWGEYSDVTFDGNTVSWKTRSKSPDNATKIQLDHIDSWYSYIAFE